MNTNAKKDFQLGMPVGTASNKLKKMIMFALLGIQGLDICHQCSKKILSINDLSVEHKEPWLDSDDPQGKFFDLGNIAFSHLNCNSKIARKPHKHPTEEARLAAIKASSKKHYDSKKLPTS